MNLIDYLINLKLYTQRKHNDFQKMLFNEHLLKKN